MQVYAPNDAASSAPVIQRVRAILLTADGTVLFIKRIKPHKPRPYWVAPGGGVEPEDLNLHDALRRELREELGATAIITNEGFVLRHDKQGKNLEEFFYICHLIDYDLSLRYGPEFDDPTRGEYIPDCVPLTEEAINGINIRTDELRVWLLHNLELLRAL